MLERVAAAVPSLPRAEQRVARILLEDPRVFARTAIDDLAEQAHVSKPTIVRFSRSVGCNGLADLKKKLQGSLHEGLPYIHPHAAADDTMSSVIGKVTDSATSAFQQFRRHANPADFQRAAEAVLATMARRGRLDFHGLGSSGLVAQDAQQKFFRFAANTSAFGDSHLQLMGAALLEAGDTIVLISNSGRTRELLEVCALAREVGACAIAITATGSPMAAACDIHLAADHAEAADRYSPMVSRLLHLLIVDTLATAVSLRAGVETLQPRLRTIKAALQDRRQV